MAKKAKKRKFSKEHLAALRTAALKRKGKRRGPYKLGTPRVVESVTTGFKSMLTQLEEMLNRFESILK